MGENEPVPRPLRKSEFKIFFAGNQAAKDWRDLVAVQRNDMVDVWEQLTQAPVQESPLLYRLKGELALVVRDGVSFERWQLKPNASCGARIWYYVGGSTVQIFQVHTSHPDQTR